MQELKFKVGITNGGAYEAGKTYGINVWVTAPDGCYVSLIESNTRPLTDTSAWAKQVDLSKVKEAVGDAVEQTAAAKNVSDAVKADEAARVANETKRNENEAARQAAEAQRVSNESARQGAETERNASETARKNAETVRVSAENTRKANETEREGAEAVRKANEIEREREEEIREQQEGVRQVNESAREQRTNTAVAEANTATSNANTAATKAGNVNAVLNGDNLTVTDKNGQSVTRNVRGPKGDSITMFPNVTIFGQPTIQESQISGFTAQNYVQFPFLVDFAGRPWQLDCSITTGADVSQQHNIFDSAFGLAFAFSGGKFVLAMSSDGTSWNLGATSGTHSILANTTYYIRISWDGSVYKLAYSTNKETWVDDIVVTSSASLASKQIVIGKSLDNRYIFNGSINMADAHLTISGKIVWEGMDDAGLATRMAIDLSNIDEEGKARVNEVAMAGEVGQKLGDLSQEVSDLEGKINGESFVPPTKDDAIAGNLASDASWNDNTQKSLVIDISKYKGKVISVTSAEPTTKQYAFLSNYVPNGQSHFASGCIRENSYPNNVTIPDDANYLYLLLPPYVATIIPNISITPLQEGIKSVVDSLVNGSHFVKWDGVKFEVYQRIGNTNKFIMLEIKHVVDHSDAEYVDLWRLFTNGGIYKLEGTEFRSLGVKLLETSENEFAFKYNRAVDFTGGYHGDERIDIDSKCYVKFLLSGVPLNQSEMSAPFEKWCNGFSYVQYSTLHQTSEGSVISGHPVIAYHTKQTFFENCGYRCVNRLDIDLSASQRESLVTDSLFTGLVCVHKNVATEFTTDTGNVISANASNNTLYFDGATGNNHYPLSVSSTFMSWNKGNHASCIISSKEITKPESGRNTLNVWDRNTDTKYYGYAPNRTLSTGDIYESEVIVKWNVE